MHYMVAHPAGMLQWSTSLSNSFDHTNQPFDESFQLYQYWITSSWVKSIWEKVDNYRYNAVLDNIIDLPFPRVAGNTENEWGTFAPVSAVLIRRALRQG
eukprot:scaffold21779_cov69-Skeletonema_dohrnii-CCMP3373.AAC.2